MSWERRKRGGQYYYRAKKIGGRVVKQYLGAGPVAELMATHDAQERTDRLAAAQVRRGERELLTNLDEVIQVPLDAIESLLRTHLVLAGYHRHARGEWRRRRHG